MTRDQLYRRLDDMRDALGTIAARASELLHELQDLEEALADQLPRTARKEAA